jgi:hypothetical protein
LIFRLIHSKHSRLWPIAFLAVIVIGTVLRPGDGPWIYDEPLVMNGALFFNARACRVGPISLPFTPAATGLQGTRGVRYGPVAVWIDQIFLAFTRDPIVMIAVRAAVFSGLNALALYWLCRTLKFSPWLAVMAMTSPWLWFYARQLWDNSLGIPLSALLVAGYADFLVKRRGFSLVLALFCGLMMLLVHLMAVALVAAMAIHLIVFERRALWKYKRAVAPVVLIVGALSLPYWNYLVHNFHRDVPVDSSSVLGWIYPMFGAHHLSAAGLENIFGANWESGNPGCLGLAERVSLLAYTAVWVGMLLAIRRVARWEKDESNGGAIRHLAGIGLAAVVFQAVLDGVQHIADTPQYYNATWIVFALFAMLAADRVGKIGRIKLLGRAVAVGFATAMVFVVISLAGMVHRNCGMVSDNYGTAVWNQIAAVREMQRYSADGARVIEFPQWQVNPIARVVLEKLLPAPPGAKIPGGCVVAYRNAFAGDAGIVVTPQGNPRSPER